MCNMRTIQQTDSEISPGRGTYKLLLQVIKVDNGRKSKVNDHRSPPVCVQFEKKSVSEILYHTKTTKNGRTARYEAHNIPRHTSRAGHKK